MQKHLHKNEVRHLLGIIGRASKNNIPTILLSAKKFQYKTILNILYLNGFIQSFEERGQFLVIRLKQIYWKTQRQPITSIQKINKIPRLNRRYFLQAKHVNKMTWLKSEAYCHIFTTNKGVISSKEAQNKNTGGFPLIQIV